MAVEKATKEEYSFFGEFESHPRGKGYMSEYPAWMMPQQLESLREELKGKEDALSIPEIRRKRPGLEHEVREIKLRIQEIESAKPKLSDKQKDELQAVRKDILGTIKDTGFTYSDMQTGRANARKLLDRMETPYIPLRKDIADACGVRLEKGKATREGAAKVFKILSHALNEESHSHQFYKDER